MDKNNIQRIAVGQQEYSVLGLKSGGVKLTFMPAFNLVTADIVYIELPARAVEAIRNVKVGKTLVTQSTQEATA